MTLEEIDASLPNGFHDAEIKSIHADCTKRRVTIELSIWLGEGPDNTEVPQEAYRLAEVMVDGLQFLVRLGGVGTRKRAGGFKALKRRARPLLPKPA